VVIGRVAGVFGVRGWVRIRSFTDPPASILDYRAWEFCLDGRWHPWQVAEGRPHGKGLVARLERCQSPEEARTLVGADIAVRRGQLPELEPGEYYWADLIGLKVVTTDGMPLGRVERLLETGSNDVLVVQGDRERLIPYLPGQVVVEVTLERGEIRVDWDPDF
jgi:16S rRNA processing protein RimM